MLAFPRVEAGYTSKITHHCFLTSKDYTDMILLNTKCIDSNKPVYCKEVTFYPLI